LLSGSPLTLIAPNDPFYSNQWGFAALNIEQVWQFNHGKGITVAVIDDSVQYNYEDLAADIWTNSDEISGNGIDDDRNGFVDDFYVANFHHYGINSVFLNDSFGHGTPVTGIITGVQNNGEGISGIAPDSKIMALRIYPSTPNFNASYSLNAALQTIAEKAGTEADIDIVQHTRAGKHAQQLEILIDTVLAEEEDLFLLVQ
jgi:subtilisin family serine protease